MAYLRVAEARAAGQRARAYVQKSATQLLRENAGRFTASSQYDVFLSHAYQDADAILGVKSIVETAGLTVYVDWIDDAGLDRSTVTVKTADILRKRMHASSCLVYAHSPSASDSVWMPWELGYFDSFRPSFVWILPMVTDYDSEFKGQEYLGLYPTLDKIESLPGRLNLGFKDVGTQRFTIPLTEAAKGRGVFFTAS